MTGMLDTLLLPFSLPFMVDAMVIAVVVSVPAALLSCFLVLKGWSLMGDAISHAVLPGVVGAYIIGLPVAVGAFAAGMVCALATGYLQENSRVKQDTVMGVVFSGMFGLGVVMYTKITSDVHLDLILFGDILGIGPDDLLEAGLISAVVSAAIILKRRDFMVHAFDPAQAQAMGLRVRFLHYGLLVLLSLTVVASLKAVGIILAIALMIAPGATAFLLTKRFSTMLLIAVCMAVASAGVGVWLSFFLDSAPAPTIVLLMTAAFIAAFIGATLKAKGATTAEARAPLKM